METKLEQIAAKAVKQRPKSVVREIRTPRSVGTGGGRPPPVTRWAPSNGCPYRNRDSVRAEPISSQAASMHRYMTIRRTRGIDVASSQAQAFAEVDADLGNRGYRRDSH
jgi:hypothetical protein